MNILAINPWIVDYAAYDFWLKPYGFLVLLEYLAQSGMHIDYIDCLDKKVSQGTFGRGKYYAEIIPKPAHQAAIPRYLRRYGITEEEFIAKLPGLPPDFILITSSMTYWYPAIVRVIELLKKNFPRVPIVIGGTYVTLCLEHAKRTLECEHLIPQEALGEFFSLMETDYSFEKVHSIMPAYERFYPQLDYVVLRTSWGCPFECSYCAIKKLSSGFYQLNPKTVVDFIGTHARRGRQHFVLYDDAFLYRQEHAKDILTQLAAMPQKINIHTPNALHLRFLDKEIAQLLKQAGFINPHFGLETLDARLQQNWGDKVNRDDLKQGIRALNEGGFEAGSFSVYLLLGYPEQNLEELRRDIEFLNSMGARVSLAEFSPVPGTALFERYRERLVEPLLHNNTLFTFFERDRLNELMELKNYARALNKKLTGQ